MLICHSILRSKLNNYTFKTLAQSDEYVNLLTLINDNTDGQKGALSIQNVARMSLVFDRYPGEWHGNKSISLVFSHLFKVYNPISKFKMCIFGDESVFYDKIEKYARRPQENWLRKQLLKNDELSDERKQKAALIEELFEGYVERDSMDTSFDK